MTTTTPTTRRYSPALVACQAIVDTTQCTPTLALDLGIKVAARRLTLARAITAARIGTPDRPQKPLDLETLQTTV